MTSSSSRGADFYFECAVLVIGVMGVAANGLILYAMVVSDQHKKQLLIFNQNVFDLCSSLLLVVVFALKLGSIYLTGVLGYWLCMLLLSENLLWCSLDGSRINLLTVTIERYLKVVHSAWSKKVLRKWVMISAAALAWICSIVYNMAVTFSSTAVVDGVCYGYQIWKSDAAAVGYGIFNFVFFFVVVLVTFVFCYGRILAVIRRQAKIMAAHSGPGSSSTQTQSHQVQTNVVKTMIIVSAFYVITWMPNGVYFLIQNVNPDFTMLESGCMSQSSGAF